QLPVPLDRPAEGGRVREFEVPVLLGRARGNQVRLALPDLELDELSRDRFVADCAAPQRAQRLHLVLVSPGEDDGARLQRRFLQALQTSGGAGDGLRTPAFDKVELYPP